ncbi:MAG: NADH:flavin oxidoreductase/NADH oxidase [Rhodospirillaceae bacterium]|jgi:2,4-dienoyl-CoA reductase-like NADH-dependent reductase (Old Yellow Enzyme family)|nr:NADH:flavin oxidoreductase/NADH oxidase [Rhodospirillaceae bacterium]MBT5666950.1 NADH:flavin oxidoreductase/NADH oxidase [Rhodospirillaceae bacterium]MBT5810766.1 NADH:flavin oxidoreductase/NADH oxidase [Rhodospirillaceae bacterium]
MQSLLFTPMDLRGVRIRNRIVVAPMLTYSAKNGYTQDLHTLHYGKLAYGGAGLILVESTKADPRGASTPTDLGIWKDEFIPGLAKIASTIKSYGATAGIQLGHSGRKARRSVPWEGRAPLASHPGLDHGEEWELVAPSEIAHSNEFAAPRALSIADIEDLIEGYGAAVERVKKAGFDVLEIHAAHGYLIHQFLSPASNQRTDKYGGSLENRMRFGLDIMDRVRQSWPDDKPLFVRISAVDEAGWTVEDSAGFARVLKAHGVDVVDCSSGGMSGISIVTSGNPVSYGYQVPYAEGVRKLANVKTMAVGLIIHGDQAEEILQSGKADLVAIGREMLHNPNWPMDAAAKLGIDDPFSMVPSLYSFYLQKRAQTDFGGRPSTWQAGIEAE